MSKECTTHHHACDCREAKFAAIEAENKRLLDVIDRAYNADLYGCQEIIKEELSRNT